MALTKEVKISLLIIAGAVIAGFLIIFFHQTLVFAQSQTGANISFPVAELGNCENEQACHKYCEQPDHMNVCLDFAEEHNLMSDQELTEARNFAEAGGNGPGGCNTKDSCETYCNNVSNIDECLAFAEKHKIISPDDIKEAQKIQRALQSGATLPGGCKNKQECEAYCSPDQPDHLKECIAFARAAGFMGDQEIKEAEKFLTAVENGAKPPDCRGEKECDVYCAAPEHAEECVAFAEKAGFIEGDDLREAKLYVDALKRGLKPLPCRGKQECDAYCSEDGHSEECINFAVAAGFMSDEEAAMARKTGGKGPGDCRSKEECETFCNDPANRETCFEFAKEHGLISEADQERMGAGKEKILEAFKNAPPPVRECLDNLFGSDFLRKFESGEISPGPEMGDQMKKCFEGMNGPGGFGAPQNEGDHFNNSEPNMPDGFNLPPDIIECVKSSGGGAELEKVMNGQNPPSAGFESKIRNCFEKSRSNSSDHGEAIDEHRNELGGKNFDNEDFGNKEKEMKDEMELEMEREMGGKMEKQMRSQFDDQIHSRVEEKINGEFENNPPSPEDMERIKNEFMNRMPNDNLPPGGFPGGPPSPEQMKQMMNTVPPQSQLPKKSLLGNLLYLLLKILP